MKLTLIKYLVLLGTLCVCVYVLLIRNSFSTTMLLITLGGALAYLFLAITDSISRSKKAEKRPNTFAYFTPGMVTKRVIRAGAFAIAGLVLVFSGTKVMLFGFPLLAMLLSELSDLLINIKNHSYYLYFDEKAVVLQQDSVKRIYPSHIREIEFRYEIFYLTLNNNQVRLIETEKIDSDRRSAFISQFVDWALRNDVNFTDEAREKLKIG